MTSIDDLIRGLGGLDRTELARRLRETLPGLTMAERFELLHRLGVYHGRESVSGDASTLRETAALRRVLPLVIEEHGVASILDIPCGDFRWLQHVPLDVRYTGADIVPEIVAANRAHHASPTRQFVVLDATADRLPRADLVLCRDLLIHLSLRDCRSALANFVASGSRLLLTNHFTGRPDNPDIVSGDFRPINLCRPPFGFPAPIRAINEDSELGGGLFRDRAMGLWRLSDLAGQVEAVLREDLGGGQGDIREGLERE